MKITIAYEVFYVFEGIYFWTALNFECLILEQSSATIMISVDGKEQFCRWSWNYKRDRLKKDIKK